MAVVTVNECVRYTTLLFLLLFSVISISILTMLHQGNSKILEQQAFVSEQLINVNRKIDWLLDEHKLGNYSGNLFNNSNDEYHDTYLAPAVKSPVEGDNGKVLPAESLISNNNKVHEAGTHTILQRFKPQHRYQNAKRYNTIFHPTNANADNEGKLLSDEPSIKALGTIEDAIGDIKDELLSIQKQIEAFNKQCSTGKVETERMRKYLLEYHEFDKELLEKQLQNEKVVLSEIKDLIQAQQNDPQNHDLLLSQYDVNNIINKLDNISDAYTSLKYQHRDVDHKLNFIRRQNEKLLTPDPIYPAIAPKITDLFDNITGSIGENVKLSKDMSEKYDILLNEVQRQIHQTSHTNSRINTLYHLLSKLDFDKIQQDFRLNITNIEKLLKNKTLSSETSVATGPPNTSYTYISKTLSDIQSKLSQHAGLADTFLRSLSTRLHLMSNMQVSMNFELDQIKGNLTSHPNYENLTRLIDSMATLENFNTDMYRVEQKIDYIVRWSESAYQLSESLAKQLMDVKEYLVDIKAKSDIIQSVVICIRGTLKIKEELYEQLQHTKEVSTRKPIASF